MKLSKTLKKNPEIIAEEIRARILEKKYEQIKNIEVGQKVKIKVDAYSEMDIIGKVLSISPASASDGVTAIEELYELPPTSVMAVVF